MRGGVSSASCNSVKGNHSRENYCSGKNLGIGGGATAGAGLDDSYGGSTGRQTGGASGNGGRADRALGGAGRREAAGAREEAARDWARRRGRGQHRSRSGDAQGHRGDEYAGSQRGGGGGADARDDAGHGASSVPRGCSDARGQVGEEVAARHRAAREDAGHRRAGAQSGWKWRGGRGRLGWNWSRTIRLCRWRWRRNRGSGWPGSTNCMPPRTTSRCTLA